MAIVAVLAVLKFLFHLYFNNRYGYFRDEFDYIICYGVYSMARARYGKF